MSDATDTQVFDAAEIKKALADTRDNIKSLVEKANEEAAKVGRTADETRNRLEEQVELSKKLDERLFAIEQAQHGQDDAVRRDSIGGMAVKSDSFRAMMDRKTRSAEFEVKTTLTNATINTAQPLVQADYPSMMGISALPFNNLQLWNILPKGATASNIIAFPRVTRTNNAGPQVSGSPLAYTEGATKPESAYSFSQVTRPVQTIAHFLPVSTQVMEDAPFLESWLNQDMVAGLAEEVQDQCLTGSGANGNLSGLVTEATAFAAESPDLADADNVVRIRSAIRQIEVQNYRPTHIVVNPADWYTLEIARVNAGTDNRFIWANPQDANDRRLWGLPVIVTNAMTAGSYLVGDMSQAMVFEKSGISIQAAYQDANNFRQNLVTLRAECRLALAVKRTEAFVTGSFA